MPNIGRSISLPKVFHSIMKKCFLILSIFIVSCGNEDPSHATYDGIVTLNTNFSASEPLAEYQAVYNVGARGAQTAAPWASLNPTGSTFDLTLITNPYFGLHTLKDLGFEAIFLNVPIITIDRRSIPADIMKLDFDDHIFSYPRPFKFNPSNLIHPIP